MERDTYHAYLLRLWRVKNDGEVWRVRLENVGTGEVHAFDSLEKLIAFLYSLGGEAEEPPGKECGGKSDRQERVD